MNIDHDRGSSTIIIAASGISDQPSYQATHTTHHTTDQLRALPGNDNSTGSGLLATGFRSIPLGTDQVVPRVSVGGGGQGGGDVGRGCETAHIISSITIS